MTMDYAMIDERFIDVFYKRIVVFYNEVKGLVAETSLTDLEKDFFIHKVTVLAFRLERMVHYKNAEGTTEAIQKETEKSAEVLEKWLETFKMILEKLEDEESFEKFELDVKRLVKDSEKALAVIQLALQSKEAA